MSEVKEVKKSERPSKNLILIILAGVLIFAIGVAVGKTQSNKTPSRRSSDRETSRVNERRAEQTKNRLEQQYKQLKDRVNKAKENKMLSEEQATKVLAKADEIYNYAKELDFKDEKVRDEVQAKRQEWQKWAKENDISMVYMLRVN